MVTVNTNIETYYADICDEIRLFFDVRKIPMTDEISQEGIHIKHHCKEDKVFTHTCEIFIDSKNVIVEEYITEKVAEKNLLEYKKVRKRGAKIVVYRALSAYTKEKKPWGSLTGIRPTKLFRDTAEEIGKAETEKIFRDTFDVCDEKIALVKEICAYQKDILSTVTKQSMDLYIGIPFCTSRCAYCSFFAANTSKDGALEDAYVNALLKEIDMLPQLLENFQVRSVYVGGGTPTALSASLLERIFKKVAPYGKGEFTVEAGRPDTITKEKLRILKNAEVNRISINPQTLHDGTLERIGRSHTAADFYKAAELAQMFDFPVTNMDLIVGLPGETKEDFLSTLERVVSLAPENITVHTLAIKRASTFGMTYAGQFAEAKETEETIDAAFHRLKDVSYLPYYMYRQKYMSGNMENIGYAKEGTFCIYNVDIMEEAVSILALGAGAASKRVFPAENRIERYMGIKDVRQYVARIDEIIEKKEAFFAG